MTLTLRTIDNQGLLGAQTGESVEYKIAKTRAEREAAFRLIYQSYLKVNLCGPNRFRMRVTPYHLLPTTQVFNVVSERKVISTLTLVQENEMGLPMQSVCADEVERKRDLGLQLTEVCSLATLGTKSQCIRHVFELFRLMAHFAHHQGADQILALIQPHHVKFYQRYMAFETIGGVRTYPSACNCEVVLMCLDLHAVQRDPPKNYRRFLDPIPEHKLQASPISFLERDYLGRIVDETYHEHSADPDGHYSVLPSR